jgi:hypothetical protein
MQPFSFATVELGKPLRTDEEMREELGKRLLELEAHAASREKKVSEEEREDVAFKLAISEWYIGPITPSAVAGWFSRNLVILTKHEGIKPFIVNDIQWILLEKFCKAWNEGRPLRFIVLKARQFGISTLVKAFMFFLLNRLPGKNGCVIAHKDDATVNLYEITRRFWTGLTHKPLTKSLGAQGMVLEAPHDSRLVLATAGSKGAKRSFTIQLLHCSEPAFWPDADTVDLGLMQVVPLAAHTMVVKESTANGVGGLFWRQYWAAKSGKSDYEAVFLPWHMHAEYQLPVSDAQAQQLRANLSEDERKGVEKCGWTMPQVAWRRYAIANLCDSNISKFNQEYPSTDREAFLVSGRPVFDLHLLEARSERCRPPEFQGILVYTGDET